MAHRSNTVSTCATPPFGLSACLHCFALPCLPACLPAVVVDNFLKLAESGWRPTAAEVARDVKRLLGGAYEEFMAK